MPDDTKVRRILQALCEVGRPLLLEEFSKDSCIASSKVARDVLHRFRIEARAVPVKVTALNRKSDEFVRAGHPEWAREQRDGAYGVGIDGVYRGPDPHKWNGHLVVLVADRYLLDMSADQLDRPGHGIHVAPLFGDADGFEADGGLAFSLPDGGKVIYRMDRGNQFFRTSPDWRADWGWMAERVFTAVSDRLLARSET